MKSEQDIRLALWQLYKKDCECPIKAKRPGKPCFDSGHAIRGTYRHVLKWVLDEADTPWFQPDKKVGG